MKILLDTHAFLWLVTDSDFLSKKAKQLFLDENNEIFLSLASIWELAIKSSIGKITFKKPFEKFISDQLSQNSILELDVNIYHLIQVESLPFYHRDPFDRLIIAQALEENLIILSKDEAFDAYGIQRLW